MSIATASALSAAARGRYAKACDIVRYSGRDGWRLAARWIENPKVDLRGLRLGLLLKACWGVGPGLVGEWCDLVGVDERAKLGELTARQRLVLAALLRAKAAGR